MNYMIISKSVELENGYQGLSKQSIKKRLRNFADVRHYR